MKTSQTLNPQLDRIRSRALVVGGVGLALSAVGWLLSPQTFFRSYLIGFLFWLAISLGSLAILSLQHMVGGGWGLVIRRVLEASTRTIPLMTALFLPLLLGLHELFEWTHPEAVAGDEVLRNKAFYLNVPFFVIRAAIYFTIWNVMAYLLNRKSREQDETGDPRLVRRLQLISGPSIVLYGATVTFASVDWAMSLEPHWFSTIYGLLFIVGQALSTMIFSVVVLNLLRHHEPLASVVSQKSFHDLGNLMLAFVMLWAYLGFSQYLITWSGNLPEEIPWYLHRTEGGWQYLALLLIGFHFAAPFAMLLMRPVKQRGRILARLAGVLLVMRLLDLIFIIAPGVDHHAGLNFQWTDLTAPLGIGGLWIWLFATRLKERTLLPVNDPRLEEAFGQEAMGHG